MTITKAKCIDFCAIPELLKKCCIHLKNTKQIHNNNSNRFNSFGMHDPPCIITLLLK